MPRKAATAVAALQTSYFFFAGRFGGGAVRGWAIVRARPTFGCAAGVARGGVTGSFSFGSIRDSERGMLVERGG